MKKKIHPRTHAEIVSKVSKVQTYYVTRTRQTSDEDPDQTSNKIEVDQRHYCTHCRRKRDERYMQKVGRGAFGKSKWACIDDRKVCLEIRRMKRGF